MSATDAQRAVLDGVPCESLRSRGRPGCSPGVVTPHAGPHLMSPPSGRERRMRPRSGTTGAVWPVTTAGVALARRLVRAAPVGKAWARRKEAHMSRARRNAGGTLPCRSTARKVAAEMVIPDRASSPWTQRWPHSGFSHGRRTINSRISCGIGGRPGHRREQIHRSAISSRCQRSSVAGVTKIPPQRSLGSRRDRAASRSRCPRSQLRPN